MPGRITLRHHCQPPTWKLSAASRRSPGKALAPAMTLNRMYHWVPRIISGVSQMSAFRWKRTMTSTKSGNSRLAGKAARNCASGCTRRAQFGRRPIQTPIGTQIRLASAISTTTRIRVSSPSTNARADVGPGQSSPGRSRRSRHAAQASTSDEHGEPERVDQRATAAVRARRRAGRGRATAAARRVRSTASPNAVADARAAARVRRIRSQHPGVGGGGARRSSRSGTCRPRRPAGGTATGRRAGSPPAWPGSPRPPRGCRCWSSASAT